MTNPLECPICFIRYSFELDTEGRPMSLPCGHTLCAACITHLPTQICPTCQVAFVSHAPNFTLQDIIIASAAGSVQEGAVASHIRAITADVAASQVQLQQHEAEYASAKMKRVEKHKCVTEAQRGCAGAQRSMEEAQDRLAGAQKNEALARDEEKKALKQAELAKHDMADISNALLPLTRSMSAPTPNTGGSQAGPSSSKRTRTGKALSSSAVVLVPVTSNDLGSVIEKMNLYHNAIYDFQGKDMRFFESGDPTIKVHGVTLRNGTIILTPSESLVVLSTGVTFDTVVITGGKTGLVIPSGGGVRMQTCKIKNAQQGLLLTGNGELEANNLTVSSTTLEGFHLEGSSKATITNADVSGDGLYSIYMSDTSRLVGTNLRFTDTKIDTLHLQDKASAELKQCSWTSAPTRKVVVKDEASLVLANFTRLDHISKDSTAKVVQTQL